MSNEQALRDALQRIQYKAVSLADAQVIAMEALALPTSAPVDERESFEAWWATTVNPILAKRGTHVEKDEDGEYSHGFTRSAWEAWQARATLPPQSVEGLPDIEPVAKASKGPVAFFVKWTECGKPLRGEMHLCTVEQAQAYATAAVQQYKEDAERYRLVRSGQHWSVINGIGDTLRGEALDIAADAIRARKAKP